MKYYLLCSGSKGNCCVIKTEETTLVIDCGNTKRYLLDAFSKIDINYQSIDAMFLTHPHIDHISQLNMFLATTIYSPFPIKYDYVAFEPFDVIQIKDIKITSIALSHDTSITVGYILETSQEKLVYITDTGYLKTEYYQLIENADYYILESNHDVPKLMATDRPYMLKRRIMSDEGHLNNEKCAEILKNVVGEKTKEVVLAHISEEANTPELALKAEENLISQTNIKVKVGLQREIVFGGKLCNELF